MRTILRWFDKYAEESLLVVLFSLMVVLIFVQVIMRYLLNQSLSWSEELARYLFIWMSFIGISYGVKKSRHINIDIMFSLMTEKSKKSLILLANILFLGFAVVISMLGVNMIKQLASFGQFSPALSIPMGVVYAALPVGFLLTAVRLVQSTVSLIKDGRGEST